ncbi:MAG TPA: anthranilate phosphoribosyltransferase [Myxococcota bacterium]|nr:anthranilate phosphoribosyltransferase [Myxococcota bacterium]
MLQTYIRKIVERQNLTEAESRDAMELIMTGKATDAQIAAYLTGLRLKGETYEEILGAARVMREKVTRVDARGRDVIDTCGMGGDGRGTFNVSTVAAFIAAGAGCRVAKHGNYAVSSLCGSANVLDSLGVDIRMSRQRIEAALDAIGIAFLFAPLLHGAMKFAVGPRREIAIRTIFNILGPLTNPAGACYQVVGVYEGALVEPITRVLRDLGARCALVVHGTGGIDEISIAGETLAGEVRNGEMRMRVIRPEDFGVSASPIESILGGGVVENSEIAKRILSGEKGPRRDMAIVNAAAAIYVAGEAVSLLEGAGLAAESIDSGRAMAKLEALRTWSRGS